MQLRIRHLFTPAARIVALAFKNLGFSSKELGVFFYLLILITTGVFIWLTTLPFSQRLHLTSVMLVFASGFFDEVRREFHKKDKALRIDRYADLPIFAGVIYYLEHGIYTNLYMTSKGHLALGVSIVLGIALANRVLEITAKGDRSPGFEVPAERLFLLAVFAVTGYNHRAYEDFLLAGLIGLALLLYATAIHSFIRYKGVSLSPTKARRIFSSTLSFYLEALGKIRIGVTLLYEALKGAKTRAKSGTHARVPLESPGEPYPPEPRHGYNYTVLVVDGEEHPVSNARVTMTSMETSRSESKYTDGTGKCSFPDMGEGQYLITIEAEGFKPEQYDRYISIDSGEVFRLHRPAVDLSVVVNDLEKRSPIPNALVTLKAAEGKLERLTDNLGVAYFDGLVPGYVELDVKARGYEGRSQRINLDSENVVSFNLRRRAFVEFEGSSLVEYHQLGELEGVIKQVINSYTEKGRKVYLVSTSPLLEACAGEGVKTIDFSSTMPEDIEPLLGEMPPGGVLIFEAVSELIHRVGLDEALRFMGKLTSHAAGKELDVTAFINLGAHGERIAAMFEKLFQGVAEVKDGRLVEKGEN